MVVDSTEGVELLLDVGLERRIAGPADIEIRGGDGRWTRWEVKVLRHSPSPAEMERVLDLVARNGRDGVLFVVAKAGSTLADAAQQDRRVAYTSLGEGVVSFLGELHRADEAGTRVPPRAVRPSWTRLGALRLFALDDAVLSQSEMARRLGVSHVAVGKQLPLLGPLVERVPRGWRATDREACWVTFLADYPGPRGLATFWTATATVADQLERVERSVREAGGRVAFSGDAAADFYAPWRRPTRITGYLDAQPPLEQNGFAAVRAADATVELRVAKDPTILPMSRTWPTKDGHERRYVDPVLAAWDLARTPGGDVDDAVHRLRERALREPLWS